MIIKFKQKNYNLTVINNLYEPRLLTSRYNCIFFSRASSWYSR